MLLFLASLQTAHPCAAMITKNDGSIAMSDAQEVILERTETGVRTRYRVTYDGDAEDFGWFIVVDGDVAKTASPKPTSRSSTTTGHSPRH